MLSNAVAVAVTAQGAPIQFQPACNDFGVEQGCEIPSTSKVTLVEPVTRR
jgi:hypothetical protein